MERRLLAQVAGVASGLVLVGLADLPYAYYILLRLALCGACIAFALEALSRDWTPAMWVMGAFAVLYNPILPVHLGSKTAWTVLNVLTVVGFWFFVATRKSERRETPPASPNSTAGLSPAELTKYREELQRSIRVSEHQPKAMLIGARVKAHCMRCDVQFEHVTGSLPILETENGRRGWMCIPCLQQLNEFRREVGLYPIAHVG